MKTNYLYVCSLAILIGCLASLSACQTKEANAKGAPTSIPDESSAKSLKIDNTVTVHSDFGSYWYQGNAELNNYDLEQSRYGEIHKGHAVLIFVTEDFLKNKQVKYEYGSVGDDEKVKVLKLNFTRKFLTGVYPYSLMTSTFSPLKADKPLKITSTMQEWCGQTYMQINQQADGFSGLHHSYFQSEGDQAFNIPADVYFEDALWTLARQNPESLPTGKIQAVPAMQFLRMKHKPAQAYEASASLKKSGSEYMYTVTYKGLNRALTITFQQEFPYQISAWEEKDGRLTTKATLKKRLMLDYWSRNSNSDLKYREELGLQ